MKYTQWNYDNTSWFPQDTNIGISELFKTGSDIQAKEFLDWLRANHSDFMFSHRDNIFSKLIESKHFAAADEVFSIKPFQFDEKIATNIVFNFSLKFDNDVFDYWLSKTPSLDKHKKSSVFKSFWPEFLTFQFMKNEEFNDNLKHLQYVFGKVPFYDDLDKDLVNGYFIKAREEFFNQSIITLNQNNQDTLINTVSFLCAEHYGNHHTLIEEEFIKYPNAIENFKTSSFNHKLDNELTTKAHTHKNKI